MDEINPREIMKLAIGAPSEYMGLLRRTYLDCMAELKIISAIAIILKLNRTTSCVLKPLILLYSPLTEISDMYDMENGGKRNGVNRRKNTAVVTKVA